MSRLYKMSIVPNMVERTVESHSRSIYDKEYDTYYHTRVVQEGFNVFLSEVDPNFINGLFEKAEVEFREALGRVRSVVDEVNKNRAVSLENQFTMSYPSQWSILVKESNSELLDIGQITVVEDVEEFREETVYIYVRKGMSTRVSINNVAWLRCPIKSNRKEGPTVRGYAAGMDWGCSHKEDEDFYMSLAEECGLKLD